MANDITLRSELTFGVALSAPRAGWVPITIRRLLRAGGPAAVFRHIVSVIVDAVNACSRRALSHIRQEVLKRLNPTRADLDAPASIPVIPGGRRVVASVLHRLPRLVLTGSSPAPLGGSVLDSVANVTGGGLSSCGGIGLGIGGRAAHAHAFPNTPIATMPSCFNYGKLAKYPAGEFYSAHADRLPQIERSY